MKYNTNYCGMKIKIFFISLLRILIFPFLLLLFWIQIASSKKKLNNQLDESLQLTLDERYEYIYKMTNKALHLNNITVVVKGAKNIPKQSCLYVLNHKSNYDVLVFFKAFIKSKKEYNFLPTSFVAKQELNQKPQIYAAAKLINTIFIDRKNLRDILRVIEEGKKLLHKKEQSLAIFLEGTRIKKHEFGPFKAPLLEIAHLTFCPIVPVVIYGSLPLNKHNVLKHKKVIVNFLTPIKYNDYINYSKEVLANEKLKAKMEKQYLQLRNENDKKS